MFDLGSGLVLCGGLVLLRRLVFRGHALRGVRLGRGWWVVDWWGDCWSWSGFGEMLMDWHVFAGFAVWLSVEASPMSVDVVEVDVISVDVWTLE